MAQSYTPAEFVSDTIECLKTEKYIGIACENIVDQDLITLASALKGNNIVITLHISDNTIVHFEGIKNLAEVLKDTNIQELIFTDHNIGDAAAFAFAEALQLTPNLRKLNISSNQITDQGIIAIAKALMLNPNLQNLDISSNQITDDGVIALADAITKNTNLTSLAITLKDLSSYATKRLLQAIEGSNLVKFEESDPLDYNHQLKSAAAQNKSKICNEFGLEKKEATDDFYNATPILRRAKKDSGITNDEIKTLYKTYEGKLWKDPLTHIEEFLITRVDNILTGTKDVECEGLSNTQAKALVKSGRMSETTTNHTLDSLFRDGFYGIARSLSDASIFPASLDVICKILMNCPTEVNGEHTNEFKDKCSAYTNLLISLLNKSELNHEELLSKMIDCGIKFLPLTAKIFGEAGVEIIPEQLKQLVSEGLTDSDSITDQYKFAFSHHFATDAVSVLTTTALEKLMGNDIIICMDE